MPFAHPLLRVPTPDPWVRRAVLCRDLLLIDHANCEKKAASTALALMFAYAEDLELAEKMSRLAREELRHYEQVIRLIRALDIVPQRLAPVGDLFAALHAAEARHYRVYMDLAGRAAARQGAAYRGAALDARVALFTGLEAQLITEPDEQFRFHSGPPALASPHSS
jgi:tRNA-(ms[2]io[6]A)-hydroxylase